MVYGPWTIIKYYLDLSRQLNLAGHFLLAIISGPV
ncbi:MAG: hypothetical protein JWQ54_3481 [Mucilaginibacter sp.]|nr:hypothetical protein [Mucilaginibacter sp.]